MQRRSSSVLVQSVLEKSKSATENQNPVPIQAGLKLRGRAKPALAQWHPIPPV